MSETNSKEIDIMGIMELIPHRYPFLLVDKVTDYEPGKYVKGYKNLTMNEAFFQGHFPNNPVMPGVLQIEALAQLSAGMVFCMPQYKGKLALFAGIDKARFKRIVRPGDRLDMYGEMIKAKGPVVKAHVTASVDGQVSADAEITVIVN
jgi:3-hydroxyacyl-[acyl-carrier-protein] dehydratase